MSWWCIMCAVFGGVSRLVHWCHGSPALVMLLDQAGRALGARPDWTAAAGRAAQDVWYRGLLTKVLLRRA